MNFNDQQLDFLGPELKGTKKEQLSALAADAAVCKSCRYYKNRKQSVFASGSPDAKLMLLSEAPGKNENDRGLPFVGKAGEVLDKILGGLKVKRKDIYICNVIKCVSGDTKVVLSNGSTRAINTMSDYEGAVKCIDRTGEVVSSRVTGWYRSPRGQRRLYRVGFRYSSRRGGRSERALVTGDHELLTLQRLDEDSDPWYFPMFAPELVSRGQFQSKTTAATVSKSPGEYRIATGFRGYLPKELAVISGSLLGDAHVNSYGSLSEGHSIKQGEYLRYKSEHYQLCMEHPDFSDAVENMEEYETGGHRCVRVRTRNHPHLREIRDVFYDRDGRKRFPARWLSSLMSTGDSIPAIIFSIWFQDDGFGRFRSEENRAEIAICAYGLTKTEILKARMLMRKFLGVESTQSSDGVIRIKKSSHEAFVEKVGEYIHKSMRYKVPEVYHHLLPSGPSRLGLHMDERHHPVYYSPVEIELSHRTDKSVYCLEVEDNHNFMTTGGVVRNCWPGMGNPDPSMSCIKECRHFMVKQIDIVYPKVIVAAGNYALKGLFGSNFSGITKEVGQERDFLGHTVIPVLHPAAFLRPKDAGILRTWKKSTWAAWQKAAEVAYGNS
jgi:uracil-DNA glycosylase